MATIGRSFDILDKKIKTYNTSLRTSQKELNALDKALNLDSGNIDAVRKKFELLPKVLKDIQEKTDTLRKKQQALNEDLADGKISNSTYKTQMEKTNSELEKLEQKSKDVQTALSNQNSEMRNAQFDNFISGLDTVKAKLETLSKITLVATAALVAYVYSALETADEIGKTAEKYNVTVEALQKQQYYFEILTGSSDTYTDALSKVASFQSSIVSGRGAKYLYYLKELGMAEEDLEGKTSGEIYEEIFAALSEVTDETERATIAYGLFGDTGLDVATIAGSTTEQLEALAEQLENTGIITDEQAAIAAEYADKISVIKNQLVSFALEILEWWDSLGTSGQILIVTLLGIIIVLPKLIAGIQAVATAMKLLNASGGQVLLILSAIAISIIAIITLMNKLTNSTNETVDEVNSLLESINGATDDLSADVSSNNETITTSNNTSYIDGDINVNVTGDTAVDKENATYIGESLSESLTADLLNYELGKLVK